jgi:hypothetical protein
MVSAIEKQILQSQVVDRIQQIQQQHSDMQQQYFNVHFAQERGKLQKKVNVSRGINHAEITGEDERKQQKNNPQEQGAAKRDIAEEATGGQEQHDHIDLEV